MLLTLTSYVRCSHSLSIAYVSLSRLVFHLTRTQLPFKSPNPPSPLILPLFQVLYPTNLDIISNPPPSHHHTEPKMSTSNPTQPRVLLPNGLSSPKRLITTTNSSNKAIFHTNIPESGVWQEQGYNTFLAYSTRSVPVNLKRKDEGSGDVGGEGAEDIAVYEKDLKDLPVMDIPGCKLPLFSLSI